MADRRTYVLFLIFGLLAIFISTNAAFAQEPGSESLALAQIHRLPGDNWDSIAKEIDRLKSAGFNGIIFRAFHNLGDRYHGIVDLEPGEGPTGVYFETEHAPVVADMLRSLSRICREREMKLFAWMTTRTMHWLDSPKMRDRKFDEYSGKLVESDRHDLFDTEFKKYLLTLLADIARNDIDGIILQDDFTIKTREGFTPTGISLFKEKTGLNLNPVSLFQVIRTASGRTYIKPRGTLFRRWAVLKADYLADLGAEIVASIKAMKPELLIGWNVYHDTALSPENGLLWLSQDWTALEHSPFDLIFLMAYHRQAASERNVSVTEAIAALAPKAAELAGRLGDRLVVKFQVRDWRTRQLLPMAEIEALTKTFPKHAPNVALAPIEGTDEEIKALSPLLRNVEAKKNGTYQR